MASEYENLDVGSPKCDISHGAWMSVAGIEGYPGNAAAAVDSLHWNTIVRFLCFLSCSLRFFILFGILLLRRS
jgi:hypothetical protein